MGIFESKEAKWAREVRETNEKYFWSRLAYGLSHKNTFKKIQKRFATECNLYVALTLAEVLKEPAKDLYHGSSEQFLDEVVEKSRAFIRELRSEP